MVKSIEKRGAKCSVNIELNEQGLQELLEASEMERAVKEQADQIASRCLKAFMEIIRNHNLLRG